MELRRCQGKCQGVGIWGSDSMGGEPGLERSFFRFRLGNHMVGAEGAPALGLVIRISGRTTPPALVR
jgi:hypothetical protein